jgi:hypothetical protein
MFFNYINNTQKARAMNISSLEQMEQIVSNNKSLSWDGWTVVESKLNAAAWMKPNAAFVNNAWYTQNRFVPTEIGWSIPNKFMR